MKETNITEWHMETFDALLKGKPGLCLFSCFLNGQPTAAICEASERTTA